MEIITSTENYYACGPIDGSIIDNILRVHSVLDLSHEVIDELTCHFNSIYMDLLIGRNCSLKDQIRVYEHLRSCFDAHFRYADFVINNKHKCGYTYDWSHYELELKGFHHSWVVNEAVLGAVNAYRSGFENSSCIDLVESDWYVGHEANDCSDLCIVNWVNGHSISRAQLEDGSFEEPLLNEVWFSGECVHGFMELVNHLCRNGIYAKVKRKNDFRARRSAPMTLGYKILRQGALDSLFAECYIDGDDSPALNPEELAEENRNLREQIELLRAENDRLRAELHRSGDAEQRSDATPLPPELATAEAAALLAKAQAAGWLNKDYQPCISQKRAAILASVLTSTLHLSPRWTALQQLWGIKDLSSLLSKAQICNYYSETLKDMELTLAD